MRLLAVVFFFVAVICGSWAQFYYPGYYASPVYYPPPMVYPSYTYAYPSYGMGGYGYPYPYYRPYNPVRSALRGALVGATFGLLGKK